MKKFIISTFIIFCMCLTSLSLDTYATSQDISSLISEEITMTQNGKDLLTNPWQTFSKGMLNIHLEYDNSSGLNIQEGDVLNIQLKPVDTSKDFIQIDYTYSQNSSLVDSISNTEIAKLDMSNRAGVKMTFHEMKASFLAEMSIPYIINTQERDNYFKNHQDENEVEYRYKLMIDDKETGKELVLIMKKPDAQEPDIVFKKTSGTYNQVGSFGEGYMLYNIKMGTKLGRNNEFLIYDTPDVNLSFDGTLSLCNVQQYGSLNDPFYSLSSDGNHWIESGQIEDEEKMEIWVYDIYYLTKSDSATEPKQAEYKEEKVFFDRVDGEGNTPIESKETVTMPKNIILTKPSGEKLTKEEEKLIEDSGGLYKEVGKGFQIRIKNFKGNGINPGGFLTMVYRMNIKGNSPMLNKDGLPVYLNTASYYGQEIPDCDPDDTYCKPIQSEKTTMNQIVSGENTTEADVDDGKIGAIIDQYSSVHFIKVDSENNKPLAGAKFNIYYLNNNNKTIAVNKDGIKLENLVTDEDGQLTKNDKVIHLNLLRGNYIFEEISAPEGYDIISKETAVSVGLLENNVTIMNTLKQTEPTTSQITISAEDITIYTGGTSISNDSFPTVRYSLKLPNNVALEDLTFTYQGKDFQIKDDSFTSITHLNEIFTYKGEKNDIAINDEVAGYYEINIEDNDKIIAKDTNGQTYTVHFDPGELLVRYVSDPKEVLEDNDTIATPVTTTIPEKIGHKPIGVVSKDTVYKTNGKEELHLYGDSQNSIVISLLSDNLLENDEVSGYSELLKRSKNYFEANNISIENRQYEFQYLDLINETDGNAWVSSSKGVDVYWPYPEGTNKDTQFEVLHFQGLHREYGFGNNQELDEAIQSSTIEKIEITNTELGIKFHIPESGFSPFVVSWLTTDDNDSTQENPSDGDQETPDVKPETPSDEGGTSVIKPESPIVKPEVPNDNETNHIEEQESLEQIQNQNNNHKEEIKTDDSSKLEIWLLLSTLSGVIMLLVVRKKYLKNTK